ncbi:hypothetical protein HMPREF1860_00390 [Prevotella amnii]|uniref:Uncharacterized protein n=1 Tax=Prevotella amnii TaxID=419005 RepID=A0A134BJJ7_9BACT|nr:hypothetical protein HMPREF1860_00390 [Prevotella amnii]
MLFQKTLVTFVVKELPKKKTFYDVKNKKFSKMENFTQLLSS